MFFMLVMLCFPAMPHPRVDTMNYTSVVLGGVMSLAMAWYYFPTYGAVHWFRGPTFNLDVPDKVNVGTVVGSAGDSEGEGSVQEKKTMRSGGLGEDGLP